MEVWETLQSCWLQQPPPDTAGYPGSHPVGLWAQEWLPLLKMTKKYCFSLKNFSFNLHRCLHQLKVKERLPTHHGGTLAAESLSL